MNINNHKFPTEKQMNKNMRTLSGRLFFGKYEMHMHGRTHLRFMVSIVTVILLTNTRLFYSKAFAHYK